MSKWKMVRLGDVCHAESSSLSQKDLEHDNGIYPVYGASGLLKKISFYKQEEEYISIIKDGAGVGRTYLMPARSSIIGTMQYIVPNKSSNIKYLYYAISAMGLGRYFSGATIPHIYFKDYKKEYLPLPPLEEQKKIATELDKINELIAKRKKQIENLDLLVKSQFVEMFGDPVTNQMGWECGTIRNIVNEVKYGTSKPSVEGGKYFYLRMNNITYDGRLDLSNLKTIDIADDELEKCAVRKGDVLFNRTNSKELVGKTCVYDSDETMVIAGYIIRIRVGDRATPTYLSAVLNSKYGKGTLYNMCKAIVGQANINAQELQDIKILIPPINLQNQFADFVTKVEQTKGKMQMALGKLEILYKARMQEYFNK